MRKLVEKYVKHYDRGILSLWECIDGMVCNDVPLALALAAMLPISEAEYNDTLMAVAVWDYITLPNHQLAA